MKRIRDFIGAVCLLVASPQVFAEELINCVVDGNLLGADNFVRGFYIDFYPGETLDKVILYFQASEIGDADYRITVRDNTYSGEVLGVADANYGYSIADLPVPIQFDFGRIAITSGSRITFTMEQLSGDANTYFSISDAAAGCPVIETVSTIPPLGESDRGTVHAIIIGSSEAPTASIASLENPGDGASVSGVSAISGWVCDAAVVEVEVDGTTLLEAAYGTPRADTLGVCGDENNGFGLLFNWALFGDGEHSVKLLADGIEVDSGTFRVTTLGTAFLSGASGTFDLMDFPENGDQVTVEWSQAQQGFVITDYLEE